MGWNAFADIGGLAMAEALKVNSTLLFLDMSNNRIGSEACISMGKVLMSPPVIDLASYTPV